MTLYLSALLLTCLALAFRYAGEETRTPGSEVACAGDCVPRVLLLRSERRSQHRALLARRFEGQRNDLRRTFLLRPSVSEAINLSCTVYGHCAELWRKARCETGGSFSPRSHNPSGVSGLFQFLPSTWASTPFGSFSVWEPYANALAAGWMHAQGRGGEWVCQ